MHESKLKRTTLILAIGLGLAAAFAVGSARAEEDKLDQAKASTAKAIALLRTAEAEQPDEPHRKKAIDLLTRAQGEILKAKGE